MRKKKTIQILIQIIFLILFLLFIINNKVQLWMGIFIFSIAASFLLGRIYCGWICPINTLMKVVTWLKKKLHIKSFQIPKFLDKPWIRLLFLGIFILFFIFTMISGKKLPILPAILVLGVILTFFFPEELWHYFLCPYGTILSLSGSKAKHYMRIDTEKCNNCSACKRVCPAKAIEKKEKHHITKKDCLVCMKCEENCKQHAISYK